jgi:hypothetical protein
MVTASGSRSFKRSRAHTERPLVPERARPGGSKSPLRSPYCTEGDERTRPLPRVRPFTAPINPTPARGPRSTTDPSRSFQPKPARRRSISRRAWSSPTILSSALPSRYRRFCSHAWAVNGLGLGVSKQDQPTKRGLQRDAVEGRKLLGDAMLGLRPIRNLGTSPRRRWPRARQRRLPDRRSDPVPGRHDLKRPNEGMYPDRFLDANEDRLTGSTDCLINFRRGQLPPAGAFRSLALYWTITSSPTRSTGARSGTAPPAYKPIPMEI